MRQLRNALFSILLLTNVLGISGALDVDQDGLTDEEEIHLQRNPNVPDTTSLTDAELLELTAWKAFLYFWDEAVVPDGQTVPILIPDHAYFDGTTSVARAASYYSIAGAGFALAAYVVADDRGWISHEAAYGRIYAILNYFRSIQAGNDPHKVKHGYLYHFYARNSSKAYGSEVSSIDHALFIAGALTAGQYYHGTPVEDLASQLYSSTEWNWMWDSGAGHLHQAWHPDPDPNAPGQDDVEGGYWNADHWNRYSELMILLALAIGPGENFDWDFDLNNGSERRINIPSSTWQNISRQVEQYGNWPNTNSPMPPHIHAGSLHNHQYSHMYLDLRNRPDGAGRNYFENSMLATLVNRQFCIDLKNSEPQRYNTYGDNVWGLSACNAYPSYQVLQPIFADDPNYSPQTIEDNNDSGTVAPFAPLGSMPFTPFESISALRYMYENQNNNTFLQNQSIWGRYGFLNSFNSGDPYPDPDPANPNTHFSTDVIGIDLGPIVGMIENYRTGLLWKYTHRSWIVKAGLASMTFNSGYVEPPAIDFESGSNPNSYGGFSGGFGPGAGSITYTPSTPNGSLYGVRITGTQASDGAWIGLNGRPIHQWDGISFWIKGDTGQEVVRFGFKDSSTKEYLVPIESYHPSGALTSNWSQVKIPFEPFIKNGVQLTGMDNISFTFTSQGGAIEVDHIEFIEDVFRPSPPQGLQIQYAGTNQIRLSWDENSETDVVGYRIYRKPGTAPNATFEEIQPGGTSNNHVLVGTTFIDTNIQPNQTYSYKITVVDNYQYPVDPYRGLESDPTPDADGQTVSTYDQDQDGLNDLQESNLGTDPSDIDTDNDYLTDSQEVNTYQTDPTQADTDNDQVNDYLEILAGTNPNNPNSKNLYLRNYTFGTANNFQGVTRTSQRYVRWNVGNGILRASATKSTPYSWATLPNLDLSGLEKFLISYDLNLNGPGGRLQIGNTQIELNLKQIGIVKPGRTYKPSPFRQNQWTHVLVLVEKGSTNDRIKLWKDGLLIINELTPTRLIPNTIKFSSPSNAGTISYDNIIVSEVPNEHMYPFSWNFSKGWGSWYKSDNSKNAWSRPTGGILQAQPVIASTKYSVLQSLLGNLTNKDPKIECEIRYLNGAGTGGLWLSGFQFDINPAGVFCRDQSIPNSQLHPGISANVWHPVILILRKNPPAGPTTWSITIDGQQKVTEEPISGPPKDQAFGFVSNNDRGQVQFKNFRITGD